MLGKFFNFGNTDPSTDEQRTLENVERELTSQRFPVAAATPVVLALFGFATLVTAGPLILPAFLLLGTFAYFSWSNIKTLRAGHLHTYTVNARRLLMASVIFLCAGLVVLAFYPQGSNTARASTPTVVSEEPGSRFAVNWGNEMHSRFGSDPSSVSQGLEAILGQPVPVGSYRQHSPTVPVPVGAGMSVSVVSLTSSELVFSMNLSGSPLEGSPQYCVPLRAAEASPTTPCGYVMPKSPAAMR